MDNQPPQEFFPTVNELNEQHRLLLDALHRDRDDSGELLDRVETFLEKGCASGAVFDDDTDRSVAQSWLDYWVATLYGAGRRPRNTVLADFDPLLAPEIPDEACPYLGLGTFHEEQAGLFHGREQFVSEMVELLRHRRLIVVVGPSGSGKSSAVLAGLIPALKEGEIAETVQSTGSEVWYYPPRMVPGSEPLRNLLNLIETESQAIQFDTPQEREAWAQSESMLFLSDRNHLAELAHARSESQPVTLVIDQFEEAFTLCTLQETRQAFIENLVGLVSVDQPEHRVILTIRSDFAGQLRRYPELQELATEGTISMTPLSAPELRRAIEEPANAIGLKYEAGLVDALMYDVLGEPAALPLLQFTLLKLWEDRQHNRVTWEAYRRLGSGREALGRSAEALYLSLIPEKRTCLQRVLLKLVRPGEGLEVTNNRIRRDDLYRIGERAANITDVVEALLDKGLLKISQGDTAEDEQVELAHETLTRSWERLVNWVEMDREEIRKRQHLGDAVRRWHDLGQDPSGLLRGALLDEALTYGDLSAQEQAYVNQSLYARAEAKIELAMARQRELDYVQALADAETEKARRLNRFIFIQAAITLLMLVGLILSSIPDAVARGFASAASEQGVDVALRPTGPAVALQLAGDRIVDIGVILMLVVLAILYRGNSVKWAELRRLYVSFRGRVSRSSYWFYFLLPALLLFLLLAFLFVTLPWEQDDTLFAVLATSFSIYFVLFLWTGTAMSAKRLHDRDRSAWWLLSLPLAAIPLLISLAVGVLSIPILVIFLWVAVEACLRKGSDGSNRFGPDPKKSLIVSGELTERPETKLPQMNPELLERFLTEDIITELEYETIQRFSAGIPYTSS